MRITFEVLKILDTIARHDSFAAAAEELNRVPSALTYSIKKLEQDLGVTLFDRSEYRTRLTPLGYELLEGGRSLLQQGQALEHKITSEKALEPHVISLACDDVIAFEYLEPLLTDFFEHFPDLSLRLSAEILNGGWDALETGRADISIAVLRSDRPHDSVYHYVSLGHIPFVFVVSPSHPIASVLEPLTTKDIQAHRIILVNDTSKQLPGLSTGYQPKSYSFAVPTMRAKMLAQLAGLGIGFLPKYMVEPYLEQGLLIEKKVEHPKMGGRFVLAWNPGKVNERMLEVISFLEKNSPKLFQAMQD